MPEAKRVQNRADDDVSIDFGAMQKVFNPAPPSKRGSHQSSYERAHVSPGLVFFFSFYFSRPRTMSQPNTLRKKG